MYLVATDVLKYEVAQFDTDVTDADLDANKQAGPGTGRETPQHVAGKIAMARFFESQGVDVPKTDDSPPRYRCFEQKTGNLRADIYVEDAENAIGEVGYTKARYLLRAFGYKSLAEPGDIQAMDDGELYRHENSDVDVFVSKPYNTDYYHIFRAGELPDPTVKPLADSLDEMID